MRWLFSFVLLGLASQNAFAALDRMLLSFAPPSSTVLTGIDVRRAASWPSGRSILEQCIEDQNLSTLARNMGLDFRRDIQSILLVSMGQANSAAETLVLARGTFDANRLIRSAQSRGASVRQSLGVSTVTARGSAASTVAAAFPQAGVLVMGPPDRVRLAIAGDPHRDLDHVLMSEAERIGPANDTWFATNLPGGFLAQEVGNSLPSPLRNSEWLNRISHSSGGLQFGESDRILLDLSARSTSDARFLAGVLKVAASVARLQLSGDPGIALAQDVLTSMQLSVDDSNLHITSSLPDQQLAQALVSAQ